MCDNDKACDRSAALEAIIAAWDRWQKCDNDEAGEAALAFHEAIEAGREIAKRP